MKTISLKPGREKSLQNHHPWVFSGALTQFPKTIPMGETVEIRSHKGDFVARGAFSPHSQIAIRIWSFNPDESIDEIFFNHQLQKSIQRRRPLIANTSITGLRLVNAESDGLPGLVVDQYGEYIVIQCLTAGIEHWKPTIINLLTELIPNKGIYERSDVDIRAKEGLKPAKGVVSGLSPPGRIEIQEENLTFLVDVATGHKTGFYLDQRENRKKILDYAHQADVLNCFAYSGGFGTYALYGGAKFVTNVEISSSAILMIDEHIKINQLNAARAENQQGDVFQILRQYRDQNRQFDLIILDPPKFAESRGQLNRALRGYKDINWLAFRILRPGGILFTFSCSGLVETALFQKVVADAALDAKREVQIIQRIGQAMDHPTALNFPEGTYLKGLVCRAD